MCASAANDFWVKTKKGKQHCYQKRKQIRYLNSFNITNILTLLSADEKSAILLRVPSLIKVEVRNFPLLHFPRWFCLVNGQLAMSLRRVKKVNHMLIPMFLSLRYPTMVSFILSTTFFITEIPHSP